MISLADLLFLIGMTAVIGGGWYCGTGPGVIASGVAVCLLAYVWRRVQLARARRRGR